MITQKLNQTHYMANYRIYYEDTDSGGVVYYANYLKFLERARTDLLRSLEISQAELGNLGVLFVVKKCNIEYFSSAKLEDEIFVSCKIAEIGKVSIVFLQEINIAERIVVKAFVKIACVKYCDGKFKPMTIPVEIAGKLLKHSIENDETTK